MSVKSASSISSFGKKDTSFVLEDNKKSDSVAPPSGPNEETYVKAKSFLMSTTSDTGASLYDHLLNVLKRVLTEKPLDGADVFEHFSQEAKDQKDPTTYHKSVDRAAENALALIQQKLFDRPENEDEIALPEEGTEIAFPNLMKICYFLEQAGVGLSRDETFRVLLALKQLSDTQPLQTVRFWGKIFGTEQNYYIAEGEYREGEEVEEEPEEESDNEGGDGADKKSDVDEEGEEEVEDKPPKIDWKPPPVVPREENQSGTNKRVYFVCNEPGKPWTKLPPVTPAQIAVARKIKKFFTGRLDAAITTFPPFPGTEANYLRAQIARISAGTLISPAGYFHFDEEEEENLDEEGGVKDNFVKNPEFEGLSLTELTDPSLMHWVHHVAHILPQGRCAWWNPVQKDEEEFEEEEGDEEDQEEKNLPQPEVGPAILTSLSEDVAVGGMPAWSVSLSSQYFPQQAVAVVSSNLWPGAYAFSDKKTFENVYIGMGHKYSQEGFSPSNVPLPMHEFVDTEATAEAADPTPEEEAALKAAQAEAAEEGEEGEGGEEMEEDD